MHALGVRGGSRQTRADRPHLRTRETRDRDKDQQTNRDGMGGRTVGRTSATNARAVSQLVGASPPRQPKGGEYPRPCALPDAPPAAEHVSRRNFLIPHKGATAQNLVRRFHLGQPAARSRVLIHVESPFDWELVRCIYCCTCDLYI